LSSMLLMRVGGKALVAYERRCEKIGRKSLYDSDY